MAETGTATISKTGCTAGNLLMVHLLGAGTTFDVVTSAGAVNITSLSGSAGRTPITTGQWVGNPQSYAFGLYCARVTANGTCSMDATVGASGEDVYGRMYEFSGADLTATTWEALLENGGADKVENVATNATVADTGVTTNGAGRLACNFVGLAGNVAIGAFTGQTGGTWTEAVAEFASATGATATLQLQIADMPSAGTINGGTAGIAGSTPWGISGFAIIPAAEAVALPTTSWLGML